MKILALMGSPRKGGNTDILIDEALKGAREEGAETEKIIVSELDISPCTEEEYSNISPDGFSVVEDDVRTVVDKIKGSDILVVGSPVFFGSITAQLKTLIDRFQFAWLSHNILKKNIFPNKKTGGFICAGAQDREEFYLNSKQIVRHFFKTINVDCIEEGFFSGVDAKESVLKKPELLEEAREMGKRLVLKAKG